MNQPNVVPRINPRVLSTSRTYLDLSETSRTFFSIYNHKSSSCFSLSMVLSVCRQSFCRRIRSFSDSGCKGEKHCCSKQPELHDEERYVCVGNTDVTCKWTAVLCVWRLSSCALLVCPFFALFHLCFVLVWCWNFSASGLTSTNRHGNHLDTSLCSFPLNRFLITGVSSRSLCLCLWEWCMCSVRTKPLFQLVELFYTVKEQFVSLVAACRLGWD